MGNLHKWFSGSKSKDGKSGWVNVKTGGTCASDEPGEGTPKCVSSSKRDSMTKSERESASSRKKSADPGQQQKSGAAKPTYVSTDKPKKMKKEQFSNWRDNYVATEHEFIDLIKPEPMVGISEEDNKGSGSGKKDACYHKVKSRYSVWPSAYASGALVKCRKAGAANWGNNTKEETEIGEACWKGYEKKGMKTMFGKRYPNCVKKTKKEDVNLSDNIKLHVEGMGNVRYCPQCKKNETREECSYGPKNWDMNSSPVALGSNTFDISSVTPSNEEYVEEKYERIQKMGRTYTMFFTFRGQYKSLQFFFPTSKRPSREDVLIQLRKIYPEAVLVNFFERDRIESEPLVTVEGVKSFGNFMIEGAAWTKKSVRTKKVVSMKKDVSLMKKRTLVLI